ncbi:hypothetical protein ATO3_02695 [Marinibacterium profundimaris]|uniref:Uncharacterized protein n=1 Tax=Marinibacterium profundimaris TaxID=1679460 RepID=A0A225NT85_9RHOB|nr:hypothetical protein ATO3_02695 [Marinibacterium profundimaris]
MVPLGGGRGVRPARGGKREVSIWDLLVWAFAVEKVSMDLDELGAMADARPNFGIEYVLIQRAMLGCTVDGGGRSESHPDADLVASAVASLPEAVGGRGMAVQIAECSRFRLMPCWGSDVEPRCEPVEWKRNKHGLFAARSFWRGDGNMARWPEAQLGRDDGYVCPVTYRGTASEVAAARRAWLQWRMALAMLRDTFRTRSDLTAFEVTEDLPPVAPWKKPVDRMSVR